MNATIRHRILHALDQLEQHAHSRRGDDVAIVTDIDPGEAKAALDHMERMGLVSCEPTSAEWTVTAEGWRQAREVVA